MTGPEQGAQGAKGIRNIPGVRRLKAAPRVTAIATAVLVVLVAAVTSAVVAPGGGRPHAHLSGTGPIGRAGSPTGPGRVSVPPGPGGHAGKTGPAGAPASNGPAVPLTIQHAAEAPGKAVNITIDDGPDPRWTPQMLAVLKAHHAHATFCMIGPQAAAHPDLVRAVVAAGHRLCDHSVHHDTTMNHKPAAYQKREILDALAMIRQAAGGTRVPYYRAPGGAFTPYSRGVAASHGMRPLGWNVDTKDFSRPGTAAIVATVKSELRNGPTIDRKSVV